jgi:SAM-dependent methyltransferase
MDYRHSHSEKIGCEYDEALNTDDFDRYMTSRETQITVRLVASEYLGRRERYLDFACGTGRMLSALAPFFQEVIGVDVSESMVSAARLKVEKAAFHIVDLTTQDISMGQFDLITAFRFFGNAEPTLRREALRVLRSKLRDDGLLVLNNHRNPSALREKLSGSANGMDLTLRALTLLLTETGFRMIKSIPIGAWMLRHRWSEQKYWNGHLGSLADRITNLSCLAHYSPDMIILARPVPPS